MRDVLEARHGRTKSVRDGPPEGEVVLFTGVRYERYETEYVEETAAEPVSARATASKKKSS